MKLHCILIIEGINGVRKNGIFITLQYQIDRDKISADLRKVEYLIVAISFFLGLL